MRKTTIIALLLSLTIVLCACGGAGGGSSNPAPFSELNWSSTEDDMISTYGQPKETYSNDDGSKSYRYDTQYEGINGWCQYTFETDGTMWVMTFVGNLSSKAVLTDKVASLKALFTEKYGECDNSTENNIDSKSHIYFYDWYEKDMELNLVEECMEFATGSSNYNITVRCVKPESA